MAGASVAGRVALLRRLRLWFAAAARRVSGVTGAHYHPEQHYMRGPGPATKRSNTAERPRPVLEEPQDAQAPDGDRKQ